MTRREGAAGVGAGPAPGTRDATVAGPEPGRGDTAEPDRAPAADHAPGPGQAPGAGAPARRVLGRGPRLLGVLLLGVLALLDLAWIARDFSEAAEVGDVWWLWSGLLFRASDGVWATSFLEPTLLVLYTVSAVTAARSSAGAGLLASAGTLTVLLRLPGLWNLHAGWVRGGVPAGLREKALDSTAAMVALGAVLVLVAAVGRHPLPAPGARGRDDVAPAQDTTPARDGVPARPTPAGGATAAVLLGTLAAVLAGWEVCAWTELGARAYAYHLTGSHVLVTLLAVPEGWYAWVLAGLAGAAACAALGRTACARPLGMTVSAPLVALGASALSFAGKAGLTAHLAELGLREQLRLGTAAVEVLAGVAVLVALSPGRRTGPGRGEGGRAGQHAAAGPGHPDVTTGAVSERSPR